MLGFIKTLTFVNWLGIVGFILSLFNALINYKEYKNRKPDLKITPLHPTSDALRSIYNGEFFKPILIRPGTNPEWEDIEKEFYFQFLLSNGGGRSFQIIQMNMWIRDKIQEKFYMIPLKYSTDFNEEDNKNNGYYGAVKEIIEISPYSTIEKRYIVNLKNYSTNCINANKRDKTIEYIEVLYVNEGKIKTKKIKIH